MAKPKSPETEKEKEKGKEKENKGKRNTLLERRVSIGVVLLFICVGLCAAFMSFIFSWQADQSLLNELSDRSVQPQNILNKIGAYVGQPIYIQRVRHCYLYSSCPFGTYCPKTHIGHQDQTAQQVVLGDLMDALPFGFLWLFLLRCYYSSVV